MKISSLLPKAQTSLRRTLSMPPREAVQRAVRRLHDVTGAAEIDVPLLDSEFADSLGATAPSMRHLLTAGTPLKLGWLCTPPQIGSGGHTTFFRMVEAAESEGHTCTILLYDRHHGDPAAHEQVIRAGWPTLRAAVVSADHDWGGIDAAIASSWQTAHVLARQSNVLAKLYFVQDFEPFFYPRGSLYALAEDSYRLGLRIIALGRMVHTRLAVEVGVASDEVPFGCDRDTYRILDRDRHREGIVFYCRPGADRRGFLLARLALRRLAEIRPDITIHTYGDEPDSLAFPAISHGRLTPRELNFLYNRCRAGLALSFTNISLVAAEMAAAGVVPVVNDSPDARADFTNPFAQWALPTPAGIAQGLISAVDSRRQPMEVSASSGDGWTRTQRMTLDVIHDEVYRK